MTKQKDGPAGFRKLLKEGDLLVLPGVYNALLGRVMEEAGFPCIYMSGFSVSTTALGRPDLGMLGLSEMAEQASRIVSAVDVPVLADADTGYGGIFSIRRTVEEYERAGLAGCHIEDQDLIVKRCGWLGDIEVVPVEEMIQRIRAALRARRNDDFFIIARTDARRKLGFEEALRRAKLYAQEGADAVFMEYLTDIGEIRQVVDAVKVPVVVVVVDSETMLDAEELKNTGVRIVLFPISILHATVGIAERLAGILRETGTTEGMLNEMVSGEELLKYIRYREMTKWELSVRSNTPNGQSERRNQK